MNCDSGLYQLLLYLPRNTAIVVGSKGLTMFAPGYYIYTGSAKRNLHARLSRHINRRKKLRWHIDYLTVHTFCLGLRAYLEPIFSECELHQKTQNLLSACEPIKGFGASDCKCYSHLLYVTELDKALMIFGARQ